MSKQTKEEFIAHLKKIASEVAEREGCRLYDLEWFGTGRGRLLRVFIETIDGQNVSIDHCARVSHGLNLLLDVDNVVEGGAYTLEVSSPGLERTLREPWHFQRVIGQDISLQSSVPLADLQLSSMSTITTSSSASEAASVSSVDSQESQESRSKAVKKWGKARRLTGRLDAVTDQGVSVLHSEDSRLFIPFDVITKAQLVFHFGSASLKK